MCIFVDWSLSFCPSSFGHCIVCSSSIYRFWLPLWYLQALLVLVWCLVSLKSLTNKVFFLILRCFAWHEACIGAVQILFQMSFSLRRLTWEASVSMTMQIIINWLCKNLPSPSVGVATTDKIKQILNRKLCFQKHFAILYLIPVFLSLHFCKLKTKQIV